MRRSSSVVLAEPDSAVSPDVWCGNDGIDAVLWAEPPEVATGVVDAEGVGGPRQVERR